MKTTTKDFKFFKARAIKYQSLLGLMSWALYFNHEEVEGAYAVTAWSTNDMVASIRLATEWDDMRPKSNHELDRLALHEVLHVLLAPLVSEAEYRYASQDSILAVEHSIVRVLENTIDVPRR